MSCLLPQVQRPIPAAVGIGLRAPHIARVLQEQPRVPWFEVHSLLWREAGATLPENGAYCVRGSL
ncbi:MULTISPECIES: hypothetical protein [Rhodanobacter]|uniref:hypothetical protein n=1 Tax=Rhodanobacter TaxID=75309 RepID=UPI00040D493B|nr:MULTISPECIES: hypothetical protein [Rhodanobacter]TAN16417.1 MAG: hypothetical protein EPN35_10365 [Rhodanobacter sp.]UJJ53151.1 hypothetical protein LRK53_09020 [Rhodanobacter thiooxydans]